MVPPISTKVRALPALLLYYPRYELLPDDFHPLRIGGLEVFFDALEEGINHRAAYFFFRAEDAEIEDEVSFVVEVVFECFILFIELVHELFECFFVVLLLGALSDKETDDAVDALVKDDDDWQSCVFKLHVRAEYGGFQWIFGNFFDGEVFEFSLIQVFLEAFCFFVHFDSFFLNQ